MKNILYLELFLITLLPIAIGSCDIDDAYKKELKRSSCDRRSYEEPVVLMHCWDTYGFCALNWMFLMALSGIAREEYKRIWQ